MKRTASGCEGGRVKPMAVRTKRELGRNTSEKGRPADGACLVQLCEVPESPSSSCVRSRVGLLVVRRHDAGIASQLGSRSRAHERSSARAPRQCDERNERKKGFKVRRHILVARDSGPCV